MLEATSKLDRLTLSACFISGQLLSIMFPDPSSIKGIIGNLQIALIFSLNGIRLLQWVFPALQFRNN